MTSPAPSPDHKASVEFLLRFEPEGPWVVTAIPPEGGKTATRTFTVDDDEADVLAWLARYQGENLYFTVNRPRGLPVDKPKKEAIAEFRWLHVDVDPEPDRPLAEEQARIEAMLSADSPAGLPPATVVAFSGGGCQAFWRLSDPVAIRDKAHAEGELELHNRHLLAAFGGDKVAFNVDRIMRLPGTVNWPNEKKRNKGRTPALAGVRLWREVAHPLAAFPKAEPPRPARAAAAAAGAAATPAPAAVGPAYADVAHLPACVPDKLRAVVALGHDPAEPNRLPSRSEWAWWATCELVRVGLADAEILAVITDPKFAISAHVLDQKRAVERYAPRQVQRAREFAVDPLLAELNEKHAVICDVGGKCRILGQTVDSGIDRPRTSLQTFGDFHNRYSNRKVKVGEDKRGAPVTMPAGKWWTDHKLRRQFDTMTFAPGRDTPHAYNLWQGFAVDAKPGDCSMFIEHLRDVACSGSAGDYEYLLSWMANAIQNPGRPGQVAVVLKGLQGTGKGTIAKHFGKLFGRHYLQVSNAAHLVGNFNDHLRDCVLLFGDEAFYAGDKRHESVLKTLITEDLLVIEKKGVDVEVSGNCVHLILASNSEWTVPAGLDDRRFFVLKVDDKRKRDAAYFGAIDAQMKAGGWEALLHLLQALDLSEFDVRAKPDTAELRNEKSLSMNAMHAWWWQKLADGQLLPHRDGWPEWACCQELAEDFCANNRKWGSEGRRSSQVQLGLFIKKVVPGTLARRRAAGDWQFRDSQGISQTLSRPWGYLMPSADECRAHWKAKIDGGNHEWPDQEAPYEETPFPNRETAEA